jgi:hypothetical protein
MALYQEASKQVLVGIYHYLGEAKAVSTEHSLRSNGVPFVARQRSTVVLSFADEGSACAKKIMSHVGKVR